MINQKNLFALISAFGLSYGLYNALRKLTKQELRKNIKQQIIKCYSESAQYGFIEPFDVKQTFSKNEQGIEFHIKLVKTLAKKPTHQDKNINPLIGPFQPGQLVMPLSNYNILLNKYPVNPHHVLLVPKQFIEQNEKFSKEYLSLSYDVLKSVDGFAFFNSHPEAGASLKHKHMQIVPQEGLQSANIINHVLQWYFENSCAHQQRFVRLKYLKRIKHYILFFDQNLIEGKLKNDNQQDEIIYQTYENLLKKFNVSDVKEFKHNIIMTSHFMMIVARKSATSNGVSLNAVGFTGSLLAKNEEEVEKLKNIKIIEILENLAENENEIFEDDVIEC